MSSIPFYRKHPTYPHPSSAQCKAVSLQPEPATISSPYNRHPGMICSIRPRLTTMRGTSPVDRVDDVPGALFASESLRTEVVGCSRRAQGTIVVILRPENQMARSRDCGFSREYELRCYCFQHRQWGSCRQEIQIDDPNHPANCAWTDDGSLGWARELLAVGGGTDPAWATSEAMSVCASTCGARPW